MRRIFGQAGTGDFDQADESIGMLQAAQGRIVEQPGGAQQFMAHRGDIPTGRAIADRALARLGMQQADGAGQRGFMGVVGRLGGHLMVPAMQADIVAARGHRRHQGRIIVRDQAGDEEARLVPGLIEEIEQAPGSFAWAEAAQFQLPQCLQYLAAMAPGERCLAFHIDADNGPGPKRGRPLIGRQGEEIWHGLGANPICSPKSCWVFQGFVPKSRVYCAHPPSWN